MSGTEVDPMALGCNNTVLPKEHPATGGITAKAKQRSV